MTTYDKNGWTGNKNPGKLNTTVWDKPKIEDNPSPTKDKNGWTGTKNPGKLNVKMWNQPRNSDSSTTGTTPKKLDIYNETSTPNSVTKSPNSVISDATTPDIDKENMIQIKTSCQQSGCKCQQFVEATSKWSKGKCNSCNHASSNHKQEWVARTSTKARTSLNPKENDTRKNELLKQSTKKIKKKCKTRKLSVEGGKLDCIQRIILSEQKNEVDIIDENVANEPENEFYKETRTWMKENELNFNPEFNEKLKDIVSKHFEYNSESILDGRYILHYLKKTVGFGFGECTGGHRWALKYLCVQLFGIKIFGRYGYCIRLKEVDNVENDDAGDVENNTEST
eukprot:424750_1